MSVLDDGHGTESQGTRLLQKPDGSETLLVRRYVVSVVKGPDRGASLRAEQPRVRIGTGGECELRLSDTTVSRLHLELVAAEGGLLLRDVGSTNGTVVAGLRIREAVLTRPTTLVVGQTSLRVSPTDETVEIPLSSRGCFGGLLGQSPAMRRVFATLEQVAPSEVTLLLEGESGTGKELAVEAVHRSSSRREGPFVIVDCGAVPPNLVEAEFFGHEKGAFTGAGEARAGALEQADGGTLFLDEIGEVPLELQPRLLRFLERRQVKRVGATRHREVDVRVIAATNRNLAHEVSKGTFRPDLYYRLAVVRIEIPALRERPEDVVLLARHFAERFARDPRELITEEIEGLLVAYAWPGNVRELRNVVERLALLGGRAGLDLGRELAPAPEARPGIGALAGLPFHEARALWLEQFERQYLTLQLERAGGVVAHAATRAGLPRQSFHRLLRRHNLRGGADPE